MSQTDSLKRSQTIRDRRRAVLKRTGIEARHNLPTGELTSEFYWILTIVGAFVALGLIMVLSSSSVTNLHTGSSAFTLFTRQFVWILFGTVAMWGAYKVPYKIWTNPLLLGSTTLAVVILNLFVVAKGQLTNGAKAWLDMGPIRLQPSEFMKIMTVLFCANLLQSRHRSVQVRQVVLYPMLGAAGVTILLCAAQRDFGGASVFLLIVLSMMVMAGLPGRQLAAVGAGALVGGAGVMHFAQRASERMFAFLNLEATKNDSGYQVYQSLLSIANGGVTGTGIGSGTSKWGYVPLAHSDFIFSVIAEELGIFGAMTVVGGFCLLVFFGVRVAWSAQNMHGAFIAGGISAWFGAQAFVNIGGVIGLIPMTGLTLPFLSYGGSSLLASMAAAGLLLNVSRHSKKS